MDLLFSLSNDCLYPSRKTRTFLQNGLYSYFQCYQIDFQHFVLVGLYGQQPFGFLLRLPFDDDINTFHNCPPIMFFSHKSLRDNS